MAKRTKAKILDTRDAFCLLEVPPTTQFVWYGARSYLLAMPWMYYTLHEFSKAFHIEGIWARPKPMRLKANDTAVDYMALPNLYRHKPCMSHSGRINPSSRQEGMNQALMSFWDAKFNSDGQLAGHQVWRWLATRADAGLKARAKIFAYWEKNIGIEDICAAPWRLAYSPWVPQMQWQQQRRSNEIRVPYVYPVSPRVEHFPPVPPAARPSSLVIGADHVDG